eukprot:1142696-Pelagomonas_calceolata.AAC.6
MPAAVQHESNISCASKHQVYWTDSCSASACTLLFCRFDREGVHKKQSLGAAVPPPLLHNMYRGELSAAVQRQGCVTSQLSPVHDLVFLMTRTAEAHLVRNTTSHLVYFHAGLGTEVKIMPAVSVFHVP